MFEFLPFLHHRGAYQLTRGYHLSDADLGKSAGILALGETCCAKRCVAASMARTFRLDLETLHRVKKIASDRNAKRVA